MVSTANTFVAALTPDAQGHPALANHCAQSATAINAWSSVLFGLPFAAAGVSIGLVALDIISSARKNAPDWVIGIFACMFFLAGMFLIVSRRPRCGAQSRLSTWGGAAPRRTLALRFSLAPRRNFLLGYRRHGQGSYRCRDLERVSDSVWLGRTAGGLAVPCGSCDFRLVRADLLVPLGRDASGPVALRQ